MTDKEIWGWGYVPTQLVQDNELADTPGSVAAAAWAKLFARWAEEDGIAVPQNLVGAGYDVNHIETGYDVRTGNEIGDDSDVLPVDRVVYGDPVASGTMAPPPGVTASLSDHQKRKLLPLYSGVVKYFPDALLAVAELSRVGNEQHNAGKPLHWDRSKSGDELDSLMRHLVDAGTLDSDQIRHSTKVAWRALANLQKEIERE